MSIYKEPLYYEIAFSFVDPEKQVDFFEKIIKKYSKIKVQRFLDIACGPSLQLREIARRGYEAIGLDSSPQMLDYLKEKAKEEGLNIKTVNADMNDFKLEKKADFAFIMMGSFNFESNQDVLSHLNSVSSSLHKGGLYLIQNLDLDWTKSIREEWVMGKEGIKVKTTFQRVFTDITNQLCKEELVLLVDDHGKKKEFIHERELKFIFPQEFKVLIKLNKEFEFLGWWPEEDDAWNLNKSLGKTENLNNNVVLLRKKGNRF